MKRHRKQILFLALLALLLVGSGFLLRWGYGFFLKKMYPLDYSDIVAQQAQENELEPALVYAVIRAESNFDAQACSIAGAKGLMQLTPDTFEWLQKTRGETGAYTQDDLYAPEVNIRYGCYYLSYLIEKYSDLQTALCAYNAGPGSVNSWLSNPQVSSDGKTLDSIPYDETRKYVNTVLKNYKQYQEIYQM